MSPMSKPISDCTIRLLLIGHVSHLHGETFLICQKRSFFSAAGSVSSPYGVASSSLQK